MAQITSSVEISKDAKGVDITTVGAVDTLNVILRDSAGNQISSFGGSGGTSHADDAAFSIGSASSLTPIGYLADEASPDSVDEGDVGVPRMTLTRKPYAVISNPTGEINATVLDYTNSNPLAVRLSDANGDYVGAGAGTEYTEDAASPADPVGKAIVVTRDDQLSTVTEAAGDWSRLRGTSKGALWVALADASGDPVTSFGGGTEYTEDVATANPQVGKAIMMERDNVLSAVTPAEGDWIGLRGTAEGALWVQDFNSDASLALLGTIDADTGAIKTAVEILDNAIAGTEMQCDVLTLPAVTIAAAQTLANVTTLGTITNVVHIDDNSGSITVDGTFWQATQPVSLASVPSHAITNAGTFAVQISDPSFAVADGNALGEGVLVQGDDGTDRKNINVDATTGDVQVDVTNSVAVTGTFWQATQPVSGTVTANLSATDNAVLDTIDAVLDTINAKLVSGTDIGDVTINNAAGAAAVNIQDGGNTITIDGTVTANLSATDNTVLDNIDSNTDYGAVVGGGAEATALRVTIANNSTGLVSIDDGGGTITVDGTFYQATQPVSIAGTVTVDLAGNNDVSLNAGSNKVGDVGLLGNTAANGSGTDYHALIDTAGHLQVDVLSGGGGGTLVVDGEAVDGADTGNLVLGTDGSNYQIVSTDASGHLQVDVLSGGGAGTQYTEDTAAPANPVGGVTMMTRDDVLSAVAEAEGDWSRVRGTAEGALWTQDFNSDAILADTAALVVDLAAIEVLLGTIDTDTGAIAGDTTSIDGKIIACNTGAVVVASGAITETNSGAIKTAVELIDNAISGTEMQVDVVASLPAGTNNIGDVDIASSVALNVSAAIVTVDLGANNDVIATGNVAHDGADSGNPIKTGGRAQEPTAQPDEVADNDRVDALHDRVGRVAVYQGYPMKFAVINCSTNGNNTIVAAAGAGKKIRVLGVTIISDGTTDVRFESGVSGTALTGQMPLQVREGWSDTSTWGLFETAANTLLNLELSAAINVHGYLQYIVVND